MLSVSVKVNLFAINIRGIELVFSEGCYAIIARLEFISLYYYIISIILLYACMR